MWQRNEYPRPQFRREDWTPLNGDWEFAFDDADEGIAKGYETGKVTLPLTIRVPFSYQYEASGIGDTSVHPWVWYKRTFEARPGRRALLSFIASDYETDVWVNGKHVCTHTGGFTPFAADITRYLRARGENVLVVRCYDPLEPASPRGKQSWTGKHYGCWYIPNTGIYGSVWIDWVGEDYISRYALIPDYDSCTVSGEIVTGRALADEAEVEITLKGEVVRRERFTLNHGATRYCIRMLETNYVDANFAWSPENPVLFGAEFRLLHRGKRVDVARARFGLRKIEADGAKIALNNAPLYQRLILDQGFWKESGLTPPSAEALKKDIELAMQMGYNGARKHQKFEDPYFYYYAEELGFLTWCEMPSAYDFCEEEMERVAREWTDIVSVARNFTSVVAYVPLNESWGVRNIAVDGRQQDFARSLYYATKALDPTRLISTNDGWECLSETDIVGIHDYSADSAAFSETYRADTFDTLYPRARRLMAHGNAYHGQPVLLTEFGGIALLSDASGENWGYNDGAKSAEEFYARYAGLIDGIYACDTFCGFCYTQLTDVQQEVNGLLYPDRTPKFDLERLRKITKGPKH